ncbi:hypothetical protein [Rhizobium aegyptiacum]|nr:hypothetical protein [Rhizobium aegyptiacum]
MLKRQGILAIAGLIAMFAILHLGLSPPLGIFGLTYWRSGCSSF